MRPCRGLLLRRACPQCHWECDRAVGRRHTTESIARIYKLHHWCGTAQTIHTIVSMQSMEIRIPLYFIPISKIIFHTAPLNPRCSNSVLEAQRQSGSAHSLQAWTQAQHKYTIKPSHCYILHQPTVTTLVFHVPFKITRAPSPLLFEEEWLFLPLEKCVA